ncbi:SURF1 family cytochrome oxidase biogenesis protein [Actinophytocola algeriensis]|uniref:SURF1-like protein n=1 Tax=Actinophytocola algeriensis TaxID=1768010 RepID=A0A7W7VIE2_9PSEU|nr:SURF1 family cytochrome oxidase biogenesis protein [Actinophytocola algeriensis]MBB4911446.1 cytochrome oxidase assembly protein ShyY1 [Actinophytocola algeriensis]MBE1479385.1 cytochrome oxidase assembly protein ShyY1 [Actinophytocola algeriensis]
MRLRLLLRPGWLALTALVLIFAGVCFTLLAPWQFTRHTERATTNDAITHAANANPADLTTLLPGDQRPDATTEWRTVQVTGEYLADKEVVARLRTVLGEPAFEVLTPFRLADGSTVVVDRGFVRPVQGDKSVTVPDYAAPPAGTVTLTARVRADERDPRDRRAESEGGRPQVYAVGSGVVAYATGLDLRPGYLQLDDGAPGVLGPLPLPSLEAGPFLSYALQWIAFGTMAILAWLYFTWREIKPGGVLAAPRPDRPRRVSVAQQIAEEEARERALS